MRPSYDPLYGGPVSLDGLGIGDLVIGYQSGSGSYVYLIRVLTAHELVNDVIDEQPILVTYCPLRGSAVLFNREVGWADPFARQPRRFARVAPGYDTSADMVV